MIHQGEAEFQQRVAAATLVHDPEQKIFKALFEPGIDRTDDGAIFYPTSAEEFREMARMFSEGG